MQPIDLGLRSNPDRDTEAARLINCYAESADQEGKVKLPIYACDGHVSFSTMVSGGATRGMLNLDDTTLYVVTGQRINRVTTGGVATDMGALATSGIAYMARNRKSPNAQIGIATSDGLFRVIENNVVSTPSLDASIPAFNSICSLDGYFIFTCANGEWFISSLDEGATVDQLDFAKANSNPDGATRGIVRGRDVIIAGPRSMEFYHNTGATDFPFERVTSTNIGIYAPASMVNVVAGLDGNAVDTVIWCANNANGDFAGVMMLDGYAGRKISPPKLDRLIKAEASPATTVRAFTYASQGNTFYSLTGSAFSWEYNATRGFWHERTSSASSTWNVVDACNFNGETILGHRSSGLLYRLSTSITRTASSLVTLRHSNDSGATWVTRGTRAVGATGAENQRVRWNGLGQSRKSGKVLELTVSNAVMEAGTGVAMTIIPPALHALTRRVRVFAVEADVTSGASQTAKAMGVRALLAETTALAT